ncbi:hypothetical protein IFM89_006959 [Coptis chinensis]|uniref:Reverse transcriptase zinc-binding domain-containing protein n=1 Tax=Coptis chinensis TaxID=261450 RepID=A0A835LKP3_9MAGN|nr:hypothetical protein IFM89_006959 [Coptis chinensis]
MITQPIDVHRRAFLWGHDINTRKVHSVNWDTIEKPKIQGGLGVHNLQHTNLALLAKKAWAVIASGKSLWVDIVKAKYLRKHDFLTVCPNPTDSRVWKDILKARSVLHKGLGWKIGDDTSINLSTDSWIPGNEGVIAPISLTNSISPLFVSNLIDSTTRKWRSNIIHHCWPEDIAKQIISIPLSLSANPDERIWTLSVNGKYTVKSGYHALHSTNTTPLFDWRIIWTLKCPPRVKVFMWKLSRDALKSSSNLFRFGLNINPDCIFCNNHPDTAQHLFHECPFTQTVWQTSPLPQIVSVPFTETPQIWITKIQQLLRNTHGTIPFAIELFAILCWSI